MLEQLVRPLEVAAQPLDRSRAVLPASACLRAPLKIWRWTLISRPAAIRASRSSTPSSLWIAPVEHLREARHHLELLGLQRRRLLDDPRERGEARAAETRALAELEPAQRTEDRLARLAAAESPRRAPPRRFGTSSKKRSSFVGK